jgi:hypothetical protein
MKVIKIFGLNFWFSTKHEQYGKNIMVEVVMSQCPSVFAMRTRCGIHGRCNKCGVTYWV